MATKLTLEDQFGGSVSVGTAECLLGIDDYHDLFVKVMLAAGITQDAIDNYYEQKTQQPAEVAIELIEMIQEWDIDKYTETGHFSIPHGLRKKIHLFLEGVER